MDTEYIICTLLTIPVFIAAIVILSRMPCSLEVLI